MVTSTPKTSVILCTVSVSNALHLIPLIMIKKPEHINFMAKKYCVRVCFSAVHTHTHPRTHTCPFVNGVNAALSGVSVCVS